MALRLVGTAYGTNTATMPAHQSGDLIVVFAFRDGNTTAPTLVTSPSYTNIANAGANTCSYRIARRIATSSSETVGTWTNATSVIVHVYRGAHQTTPIGVNAASSGSSTTVTYPALTLGVTDGSSWVAGFAGHRSVDTTLETPPTGMVLRGHTVDATDEAAGHDTAGGVTSWSSTNVSVGGTASGWYGVTIEIRADTSDASEYQRVRTAATRDSVTNLPGIPYWGQADPLYFISNGTGQTTALRFTGINIPQGSTIVDARITLYAAGVQSVASNAWVTIGTEQVDNAGQLASAADHESRKGNVGATPQWGPAAATIQAINGPFMSPNLAAIVQEIVDRSGWASGNAIQFFAAPNPSTTVDYQYRAFWEGVAAAYPVFEVVWQAPSGPVEGAGALVGEGVVTGTARTRAFGAGAAAGEGRVTGAATVRARGAAAAVGEGVVAGSAITRAFGAVASVGEGVVTGEALTTAFGDGALVGEGLIAASGSAAILGAGAAVGEGVVTGAGRALAFGAAAALGEGRVTGAAVSTAFGLAAAAGDSEVAASGLVTAFGEGHLVGEGQVFGAPEGADALQVSWLELEAADGEVGVSFGLGAAIGSGDVAGAAFTTALGEGHALGEGDLEGGASGIQVAVSWIELEAPTDALGTAVSWLELEAESSVVVGAGSVVGEGRVAARGRGTSRCPEPVFVACDPRDTVAVLDPANPSPSVAVLPAPDAVAPVAVLDQPDGC